MALKDLMRRWLRLQMVDGSNALKVHDAIEERFTDLQSDLTVVDQRTLLPEADDEGLTRWGIDIGVEREVDDDESSYRATLIAYWRGNAVTRDAIVALLNAGGFYYRLHESQNDNFYLDDCFLDNDRFLQDGPVIFVEIISLTSYDADTVVLDQSYLDQGYLASLRLSIKQLRVLAALQRIKAYGVPLIIEIPDYLSF